MSAHGVRREKDACTDQAINMKDKTFLRGHQVTDGQGKVEFMTIYPGAYMPRLSHIHVRLMWRDVEWTSLDTQLFLPPDVERDMYQTAPMPREEFEATQRQYRP